MSIFVLTSNIIKLLQFNELINDNMMLEINTYWGDAKSIQRKSPNGGINILIRSWHFMKKSVEINNTQMNVANTWWHFMKKSIEIMHNTSGQYVVGCRNRG